MFCKCGCVVLSACRALAVATRGGAGPAGIMDAKVKERGILKMDSRPKDTHLEVTPMVRERLPASPQPSVDRLSVTWADPEPHSMASSVNLFRLPSEPSEVKFSPAAGDGSDDEDYSASLSAVLRQRRASVRRSRKGRSRRPSSPFLPDDARPRRRSSVFTTSSGDTAISMEESQPAVASQEQILENIHLNKEVLGSVKQQPLGMRRKLKLVHQAKAYIKRHEGQLQERLAQSKSTRDIYARFNILLNSKWQQMKREAANTSNLLIPWELRIKEIESHFGSVVASYFTFLRWLFWVNLVIAFILLVFVIVPEYLTADPHDSERKQLMDEEKRNASNLLTLWEFEGILKFSAIFYGFYSNVERPEYTMPLAYFLTGLAVYIYSFVAILRKMAENSRMSKLSEKEDECIFSWKLFTGWDFMIGNAETAHNRIASVILGFKEALLEEAEKKKDLRNWRIISLRAMVNICVVILLVVSAFAVVTVVSRTVDTTNSNWWRENETTIVVTVISITFPVFFEMLGFLEHYHPRKQLRLQLARIMLLNLLNLYSLIFALFSKIEGMSKDLDSLKPIIIIQGGNISYQNNNESLRTLLHMECYEVSVSCEPCNLTLTAFPPNGNMHLPPAQTTHVSVKPSTIPPSLLSKSMVPVVTMPIQSPGLVTARQLLEDTKLRIATTLEQTTLPTVTTSEQSLLKESTRPVANITDSSTENTKKTMTKKPKPSLKTTPMPAKTLNSETVIETPKKLLLQNLVAITKTTTEDPIKIQKKLIDDKYLRNATLDSTESTEDENEPVSYYDESVGSNESAENEGTEGATESPFTNNESSTFSFIDEFENITSSSLNYTNFITDAVTTNSSNYFDSTITDYDYFNESDSTASVTDITTTDNTTETLSELTVTDYNLINETNDNSTTESERTVTFKEITEITKSRFIYNETGQTTPIPTVNSSNVSDISNITTKEVIPPYAPAADPILTAIEDTATDEINSTVSTLPFTSDLSIVNATTLCPNITFNCTTDCEGMNVTQVFLISNCTLVEKRCYKNVCHITHVPNTTDIMFADDPKRKTYNLTVATRRKLRKLCWETMFGQELVKLTMMDLVFVLLGTLFMDFFRALFVRYMNRCWCWDLEKKFPEYGDFKIAENILHLINNQGLVWMGMFFSPGLVVLNVSKLMIMMYLRSWAVMTCNVPHEVVFRVSKSNNFYLALLLTMLFLCVLPVGYTIVWVKPSWHCGPFSEYDKIYYILTSNIYKILPKTLNFALEYMASPAIVIPMLVLLILIIYYLTSLTNSLREANNDLKIQLRRERTEERRKMFQLADTRRAGSSALDNTPFARWKKALPVLPLNKSVDSDDRKTTTEDGSEPVKATKKKGGLLAKIVALALDKKTEEISDDVPPSPSNLDDETDSDFHETLPKELLKIKDITIVKHDKKKNNVEFKTENEDILKDNLKVKLDTEERSEKRPDRPKEISPIVEDAQTEERHLQRHQTDDSTTSKQSDSFGSVIPVITISTTESDDEVLHSNKESRHKKESKVEREGNTSKGKSSGLRRQSSVDSGSEKLSKERKADDVQKYQHTL